MVGFRIAREIAPLEGHGAGLELLLGALDDRNGHTDGRPFIVVFDLKLPGGGFHRQFHQIIGSGVGIKVRIAGALVEVLSEDQSLLRQIFVRIWADLLESPLLVKEPERMRHQRLGEAGKRFSELFPLAPWTRGS